MVARSRWRMLKGQNAEERIENREERIENREERREKRELRIEKEEGQGGRRSAPLERAGRDADQVAESRLELFQG